MTSAEIETNCQKPGVEGAMWRLVKIWDPDKVGVWMQDEMMRGTHPHVASHAVAEAVSAVIFGFCVRTDDAREAMLGRNGVVTRLNISLQAKVNRHNAKKTAGGVFLPDGVTP